MASQDILLNGPLQNLHPVKSQSIDEERIRKAAIRTKGGSSPAGMDSDGWRRILASNNFGTSSSGLRKTSANVVQKLCTDLVESHTIEAFLSCRLISLEKNPELRPMGMVKFYVKLPVKLLLQF